MVMMWKSKGLSDESIKPPTKTSNNFIPRLDYLTILNFK